MPREVRLKVTTRERGVRLDRYLVEAGLGFSRSQWKQLILAGNVSIGGHRAKVHREVRHGEEIVVHLPDRREAEHAAEPIPLQVVYEDGDLLVVDKPAGMVVHPACGHHTGTLVNALLHRYPTLSDVGGPGRPGILHRLDKDTSGLLLVARTNEAHHFLARELEQRRIQRRYQALVWGRVGPERGQIEAPIGRYVWDRKKMAVSPLRGREATTEYEVRTRFGVATLLELKLLTGRTHQIRVHLQHLGYPVVGDPTYGGRRRSLLVGLSQADRSRATRLLELLQRQALHAIRLGFTHPRTREHLEFNSPLPEDMSLALAFLKMPVE